MWHRRRGAVTAALAFLSLFGGFAGLIAAATQGDSGWRSVYPLAAGVVGLMAAMSVYLARHVGKTRRELVHRLTQVEELSARNLMRQPRM